MKRGLVEEIFPVGKTIDYDQAIKLVEKHWPVSEEAEGYRTSSLPDKLILTFPEARFRAPGSDSHIHAIAPDGHGRLDYGSVWSLLAEMMPGTARWMVVLQKPVFRPKKGQPDDYEVANVLLVTA